MQWLVRRPTGSPQNRKEHSREAPSVETKPLIVVNGSDVQPMARNGSFSGIPLRVFGYPPENFPEDLPLRCIAHIKRKVLGIRRNEKV